MKKFEEEYDKFHKENHNMYKTSTEYHKALKGHFKDVIFLEDHQAKISGYTEEIQRLEYKAKEFQESAELEAQEVHKLRDANKQLKSQLDSQQPDLPEFVAEYLKRAKNWNKARRFSLAGALKGTDFIDDKTQKWLEGWHNQEIFAQAWINDYTVKEKRFYLKHKSVIVYDCNCGCGSSDTDELYLMADGNFAIFKEDAYKFTQSEIDSMETGSYEQIPVEDK